MTSDIGMTTPTLSDDEHIDDAEPVTAAAAAAARHKVHWDLERGMSLQGAMDARDVTREEEDASHQKNTRQRREQRNRKGSEEWGKGRVEVTNEIDRLDEHEAREERLRRKRREERRKREKAREKERIRDEEAALEEEETSSLDDSPAPKREPKHAPHDVETDISTAARDMDSSADEGTPDAAPGPAPATGFTEKHQQDTETGEMEMTMHVSNGGEDAGDLEEMQNEDGEAGGKVRRRKKGVVASLLGTKSRNSGNDENESTTEDRGPRRARRRPSLKILRKRRRWEEGALFARSVKDAGTTDSSGSGSESNDSHSVSSEDTDTSDGDTSREDERRHRLHWIKDNDNRRHYPTGKRVDAYNPQAPRGLASASSSRRSSQTTLTDDSGTLPSSRPSSERRRGSRASGTSERSSLRSRDPRNLRQVRRARRAMKEDLNEPYIPAYRSGHTDPTNPGSSLKLNQYWDSALRFARLRSRGMSFREAEEKGVQTGQYRTIAALIIATSGLVGPAAPRLAHLAPASGRDAETSKGQRKLAEYTNPREKSARMIMDMTEDARAEAQEMGVPLDSKEKVDLANEALMKVDKERGKGKPLRGRRHQRRFKITKHISDVMERQEFIEHLAKALINFGAPAHSIETWLEATSDILEIDASFIYFPSVLIVAFRDTDVHSTETLFIRPKGGLDLYRLALVHKVYRKVVHDEISVRQGSRSIKRIVKESKPYHWSVLFLASVMTSAGASAVAFSGSFVDMLMAAVLSLLLAWVQLFLTARQRVVTNIFEIGTAGIIAFLARALGSTGHFCYASLVSSAIILILPGWFICLGALELGSRNIVSGAIRSVWAIVYTLFLSFAISIGSEVYDSFGPSQPSASNTSTQGSSLMTVTVQGSFSSNNTAFDNQFQNGTFTFQNGTSSTSATQVICYRDPANTQWWYITLPAWTLFFMVPILAFGLGIWFRADYRSRDMAVMVLVASCGYCVYYFVKQQLPNQTDIVSAVGAFTIGILGNAYSRLFGGSAFPCMVTGILLLVPNSIAAAGGLSASSNDESSSQGQLSSTVLIAVRMVQTSIGLAVGLFASAVVVYPFRRSKGFIFAF